MKIQKLPSSQIKLLYMTALVADAFFLPLQGFFAWQNIWIILISTTITCVLVHVLMKGIKPSKAKKGWYISASVAFVIAVAYTLLEAEEFYRVSTQNSLSGAVALALLMMAIFYVLICGARTLVRACGLFLCIFGIGALLMLVGNIQNISVTNLQLVNIKEISFSPLLFECFRFQTVMLLFGVIPTQDSSEISAKYLYQGLWLLASIQIAIALLVELAFGANIGSYERPLFALTQIGGISVFQRLEALHFGIWLLALCIKSAILLMGASYALLGLHEECISRNQRILLLIGILCSVVAISFLPDTVSITIVTFVSIGATCILCVQGRKT